MKIKVLIHVQHLLGTGHLQRMCLIAKALAQNNFAVQILSGGLPNPHSEDIIKDDDNIVFTQLPPIQSDAGFTGLFDENMTVINDKRWQSRSQVISQALIQFKPDLILIESFPFARRAFKDEILNLITLARIHLSKIKIATSVRDIIQPKPKREAEIIERINSNVDFVIVHGDESFINLDQSFAACDQITKPLFYSGYIKAPSLHSDERANESHSHDKFLNKIHHQKDKMILVSAGGGAVGKSLVENAIEASQLKQGRNYFWHILTGKNQHTISNDIHSDHLKIEKNRSDFLTLMTQADVSVSQIGYNTFTDILATQTPCVIVPFEGDGELEQLIRAQKLDQQKMAVMCRERRLNPNTLLSAIEQTVTINTSLFAHVKTAGLKTTVDIIQSQMSDH